MTCRLALLLLLAAAPRYGSASCAATPVAAARLAVGGRPEQSADPSPGSPASAGDVGFRAVGTHWDPLLKMLWFRVLDCEHPERPSILVPVSLQADVASSPVAGLPQKVKPKTLAVHVGQTVDLLYQQGRAEIHLRGISEGNGAVGDHILLRPIVALGSSPEVRFRASVTADGQGVLLP
jgi:hypothetical protein